MMESLAPKSAVLKSIVSSGEANKNAKVKRLVNRPKKQDIMSNDKQGNPRLNFLKKVKSGPGQ